MPTPCRPEALQSFVRALDTEQDSSLSHIATSRPRISQQDYDEDDLDADSRTFITTATRRRDKEKSLAKTASKKASYETVNIVP